MATMPMQPPMPGQPPQGAPAAPEEPTEQIEAPSGYTICIEVGGDGSLSVGMEGDEAYKPAADIKDALTQALEIYKADGKPQAAEQDFDAGFAGKEPSQGEF